MNPLRTEPQRLQDIADRLAGYDPNALPVAQAQAFIAALVPTVQGIEQLALRSALGRVLAQPILSPLDVPSHDNSAMDGYALRGQDLRSDGPTELRIAGKGLAGQRFEGTAAPGECVRITTGAVMPAGLDTVVPQELATVVEDRVRVEPGVV
ncbi:MAG: molybdopterin molybdenumtransferase MoeA, partial [Betaproteobacteria bacterium]